jgi:hypothetical protein
LKHRRHREFVVLLLQRHSAHGVRDTMLHIMRTQEKLGARRNRGAAAVHVHAKVAALEAHGAVRLARSWFDVGGGWIGFGNRDNHELVLAIVDRAIQSFVTPNTLH